MKRKTTKLTIIVLGIVLFNAAMVSAQPVYFADANLKQAVEEELGISDPTADDMLGLTGLTANNKGIDNLTGLEYGVNLTMLVLVSNQISDISPLSGLTNLWELVLAYNQISDISPLSGLTNLMELDLQNNPLNREAYCTYLPLIEANNPGIWLFHDPDPCGCPTPPLLVGDFNQDCRVNWGDFSIFASHWLQSPCTATDWCGGADLDNSSQVNWGDFSIFASHWLECNGLGC